VTFPGPRVPRDPQPLLDRLTQLCAEDDRIVAAFIGGSHARGEADPFSDADLCVIAKDDDLPGVVADRARLVGLLGRPLFVEDFGLGDIVFFVLADGTEGEIFFGAEGRLDELEPGRYRTVFDPDGILDAVVFDEERADPDEQREVLRQTLTWFWHELSHFIAAIGREQLWWAAGQLEALRGHCVNLVRMEHGSWAAEEPYEKLDLVVDVDRLGPLRSTFVPIERENLLRAANDLVRFFTKTAPAVAEAHGATYPVELEHLMVDRLEGLREPS
jgi:predicted nucleotidyltransferase